MIGAWLPSALIAGLVLYGWLIEPHWLRFRSHTVPLRPFSPEAEPVRVVHLTDTHGRTRVLWGRSLARVVNGLRPDIVLVTGDLANRPAQTSRVVTELSRIRARYGCYFVPGNWEYHAGVDTQRLLADLRHVGITVLRNESVDVPTPGGSIHLVGLDDPTTGRDDCDRALDSLVRTGPVLACAHFHGPVAKLMDRVDFLCSGHTHGGQVRLPVVEAVRFGRYRWKYFSGMNRVRELPFSISHGVGTIRLPIRFLCRPEICIYTLTPEQPGPLT